MKGIDIASSIFGVDKKQLLNCLKAEENKDEYVFAEEILEEVRNLLSIPEYIYAGYEYAKADYKQIEEYGFIIKEWK